MYKIFKTVDALSGNYLLKREANWGIVEGIGRRDTSEFLGQV